MSILNKKRLVNSFLKYVKISSPSGHEANFAQFLKHELELMGLKVTKDKAGNLYTYLKGNDKKTEPILLNAHIDTVTHDKRIRPRITSDGYITSHGDTILGADNKAGVAVIVEILRIIKEDKLSHGGIQAIFTVQEETGLHGSSQIKKKDIKAKIGFVLDGGDVDIIHHKAPCQYNIIAEIFGKAAHAGVRPEEGINAIQVASDAISRMKLGRIDIETTANIGLIEGGRATNIVPDKVFIRGEARSHNMKKLKAQINHMKECLSSACSYSFAKLKIKSDKVYDLFHIGEEDHIVKIVKKSLQDIKLEPKLVATGGGSDANVFNALGVKSLILGVGADRIHTNFERIKIDDLHNAAKFLLRIIKNNA